jgi:hypothetical protein
MADLCEDFNLSYLMAPCLVGPIWLLGAVYPVVPNFHRAPITPPPSQHPHDMFNLLLRLVQNCSEPPLQRSDFPFFHVAKKLPNPPAHLSLTLR